MKFRGQFSCFSKSTTLKTYLTSSNGLILWEPAIIFIINILNDTDILPRYYNLISGHYDEHNNNNATKRPLESCQICFTTFLQLASISFTVLRDICLRLLKAEKENYITGYNRAHKNQRTQYVSELQRNKRTPKADSVTSISMTKKQQKSCSTDSMDDIYVQKINIK